MVPAQGAHTPGATSDLDSSMKRLRGDCPSNSLLCLYHGLTTRPKNSPVLVQPLPGPGAFVPLLLLGDFCLRPSVLQLLSPMPLPHWAVSPGLRCWFEATIKQAVRH